MKLTRSSSFDLAIMSKFCVVLRPLVFIQYSFNNQYKVGISS